MKESCDQDSQRGVWDATGRDVEPQWELQGFCTEQWRGRDFVLGWSRIEKAKVEKPVQYLSSEVSHKRTSRKCYRQKWVHLLTLGRLKENEIKGQGVC